MCAALGAMCLLAGLNMASAAEPGPGAKKTWLVSSDELIQAALTNNLDIQISRIQPRQDLFAINGLYSAYEPAFGMSARHNYSAFPSGIFTETGQLYPGGTQDINSYQVGIGGAGGGNILTPWGLSYSMTGPISQQRETGAPEVIFLQSRNFALSAAAEKCLD